MIPTLPRVSDGTPEYNVHIESVLPLFYGVNMSKSLTPNQMLGEIGEAAARQRFLSIGFQFDGRSRLEAGIDGIAEVMDDGRPMARMIAVQVKATESGRYTSENDRAFSYLLRSKDLAYWRGSNLPIIIVLYRKSDETFYWREAPSGVTEGDRRLQFDKQRDVLDRNAVDRLAALTVPKAGLGYYVPPLAAAKKRSSISCRSSCLPRFTSFQRRIQDEKPRRSCLRLTNRRASTG